MHHRFPYEALYFVLQAEESLILVDNYVYFMMYYYYPMTAVESRRGS
jgi:hypothetical protein